MSKTARTQASIRGFTLVELLVVIAIIAILAAVVVLIINPIELTKRGRDATRLADLSNLQQAINVAVQDATSSGTATLCVGGFNNGTLCQGDSQSGSRNADGTGWVKVNLSSQKSVSVPTLPIDPINNATYHYTYGSDGNTYEIDTVLESDQQKGKMATDGGDNDGAYEVGSNLKILH